MDFLNDAKEKKQQAMRLPIEFLFNGLQGLICAVVFGYFALGLSKDATSCIAAPNEKYRIPLNQNSMRYEDPSDIEGFRDVAERWSFFFDVMFGCGCALMLLTVVFTIKIYGKAPRDLYDMLDGLSSLSYVSYTFSAVILAGLVTLLFARHQHPGLVCAGDFIKEGDSGEAYLLESSMVLLPMTIVVVVTYLCGRLVEIDLI